VDIGGQEYRIGEGEIIHGVARGKSARRIYELLEWQNILKDANPELGGNEANCKTALDYVLGRTNSLVPDTEDGFEINGTPALLQNLFNNFRPPFEVQIPAADKETVDHFVFLVGQTRNGVGIVFDKNGHEDTFGPTRFRLLDLKKLAWRHVFIGSNLNSGLWSSY
jgi:hypothetical protein